jgi:hypothetical protein
MIFFFFAIILRYLTCDLDILLFLDIAFASFFFLFFFSGTMSTSTSHRKSRKRSRTELAAAKEMMDKRGIVIERAVIRQDVMMAPFSFIHQIFRDN